MGHLMSTVNRHTISLVSKRVSALARVAQLVGASFCRPKGLGFNSRSGPIPRLQVLSLVGARRGKQPIDVSLSHRWFSPSFFLSLKVMKTLSSGED